MAELIDARRQFVIVMGRNGAGKSACRQVRVEARQPRGPARTVFDQDSLAGGRSDGTGRVTTRWTNCSPSSGSRTYHLFVQTGEYQFFEFPREALIKSIVAELED